MATGSLRLVINHPGILQTPAANPVNSECTTRLVARGIMVPTLLTSISDQARKLRAPTVLKGSTEQDRTEVIPVKQSKIMPPLVDESTPVTSLNSASSTSTNISENVNAIEPFASNSAHIAEETVVVPAKRPETELPSVEETSSSPAVASPNLASSSSSSISLESTHDPYSQVKFFCFMFEMHPAKAKALVSLKEIADKGGIDAEYARINYKAYLERLEQGARQGDSFCFYELSKVYDNGNEEDREKYIKYLLLAANNNKPHPEALLDLGIRYEQGFGSIAKDLKAAENYYRRVRQNYDTPYECWQQAQDRLKVLVDQKSPKIEENKRPIKEDVASENSTTSMDILTPQAVIQITDSTNNKSKQLISSNDASTSSTITVEPVPTDDLENSDEPESLATSGRNPGAVASVINYFANFLWGNKA